MSTNMLRIHHFKCSCDNVILGCLIISMLEKQLFYGKPQNDMPTKFDSTVNHYILSETDVLF